MSCDASKYLEARAVESFQPLVTLSLEIAGSIRFWEPLTPFSVLFTPTELVLFLAPRWVPRLKVPAFLERAFFVFDISMGSGYYLLARWPGKSPK